MIDLLDEGSTAFIEIKIIGEKGKTNGGNYLTLEVIGRLGRIGARPNKIGMVSDGAAAEISTALQLSQMALKNDRLLGDVIITTHICPDAPTQPHFTVDFMGSPVDMITMN